MPNDTENHMIQGHYYETVDEECLCCGELFAECSCSEELCADKFGEGQICSFHLELCAGCRGEQVEKAGQCCPVCAEEDCSTWNTDRVSAEARAILDYAILGGGQ